MVRPRLARRAQPVRCPVTEAVARPLPAENWADGGARGGAAVPLSRRRPRARHRRRRRARRWHAVVAARRLPLVIDADGLNALGTIADDGGVLARPRLADGAHTPRWRVRPPRRRAAGRGPHRSGPRRSPAGSGAVVLAEGLDDDRRRSGWRGAARRGRVVAARDGGDRRRLVGHHRRLPRPWSSPPLRAAALGAHVHGRAAAALGTRGTRRRRPAAVRGDAVGPRRRPCRRRERPPQVR